MTQDQNTNPELDTVDVVEEPRDRVKDWQAEQADKAREEYLAQTKASRKGEPSRYAAYDSIALAFIEGTISTSSDAARKAAKALGREGDHIETRPV